MIAYIRRVLPKAQVCGSEDMRDAVYSIVTFYQSLQTKEENLLRNFAAGAIGGTAGTILNTPFDVVKSRVQIQPVTVPLKYGWAIPALRTIVKEEGLRAMYKGFVPKVLRLGPGGGILLVVFEGVSGMMRKYLL